MKKQPILQKAFLNMREAVRNYIENEDCTINPSTVGVMITLAWVLDLLPPHIDEVSTDRLIGDLRKNLASYVDTNDLLNHLMKIEVQCKTGDAS